MLARASMYERPATALRLSAYPAMELSPHRRQLFFDSLFYVGPFRRGQLHRADELVGVELLRRRDVLDPHIGLDRLPRDLGKLRIDGAEPVLLEGRNKAQGGADLLSVEQDFTRGRRAALKFLEAFYVQLDRLFRIEISEFEPLHKAVDERLADLRLFLDRRAFAGGDDAAHPDAVVLVEHGVDFDTIGPERGRDAAEEVADHFELLVGGGPHQAGRIHGDDVDLAGVDAGRLHEGRPKLELAAADVEADRLALELLRLGDVQFLEREDSDRRARPDAGDRYQIKATADAARLNGHVEEAEVVLALVDRDADLGRAEAAVDGDIETAFLPVPELLGHKGEAIGAERQPRQREFERGRGANDRGGTNAECAGGAGDAGELKEGTSMECHTESPLELLSGERSCKSRAHA